MILSRIIFGHGLASSVVVTIDIADDAATHECLTFGALPSSEIHMHSQVVHPHAMHSISESMLEII